MSKEYVIVPKEDYVDTCDAIREKINSTTLLKSDEMAQAVRNISASAKEEQEKNVSITENGTTEIIPDENKTLSKVTVNVDVKGEEFIGIKYSDYDEGYPYMPHTADARSLDKHIVETLPNTSGNIATDLFLCSLAGANYCINSSLETIFMPSKIKSLAYTFKNCTKLKTVIGDLPKIEILRQSFYECSSLIEIPYMPNLQRIQAASFYNCTGLTSVNIYNTLIEFASNAFQNCSNLLDIYVPWSEGEVANAPWGATNATIHYNTLYDDNHQPIVEEV